jgi:hypothetical protein
MTIPMVTIAVACGTSITERSELGGDADVHSVHLPKRDDPRGGGQPKRRGSAIAPPPP